MPLSDFGRKISQDTGILQLMDDLGRALATIKPLAMFGGGNPAHIPAMTAAYKASLHRLLEDAEQTAAFFGNYDTPQGNAAFITAVCAFFNRQYNLGISEENIAITPGSQAGYFMLFNILAGKSQGRQTKILFPLVPEYIGYVDQMFEPDGFVSLRPVIEKIAEHEFKYHVDFKQLTITDDIAGLCVSRPTNPTGNVITDQELERLGQLARDHDIPLLIDNAYGLPFPGVVVPAVKPYWSDHTILSFSLSKVGLPASRTGIFIGPAALMQSLTSANAVLNLASPGFGQYIMRPLLASDEILDLSRTHIKPYYLERAKRARALIDQHFPKDLPWRLHRYEGSYFFWLWLEGAKLSSRELYNQLKAHGVFVVPGEYFFPGQTNQAWAHRHECLRLNFARPDQELEQGIPLLAEAVRQAYA